MNTKLLAAFSLVPLLSACAGSVVVEPEHPHHRPPPVVVYAQPAPVVVAQPAPVYVQPAPVYAQPAPMVAQPAPAPAYAQPAPVVVQPVAAPAPAFVEEGTLVGGVVVAEPVGLTDYVLVGGAWYYYHPGLRVWVHARHPGNWHPHAGVHVYNSWAEHPRYRR